jgi:hypothetical protein
MGQHPALDGVRLLGAASKPAGRRLSPAVLDYDAEIRRIRAGSGSDRTVHARQGIDVRLIQPDGAK